MRLGALLRSRSDSGLKPRETAQDGVVPELRADGQNRVHHEPHPVSLAHFAPNHTTPAPASPIRTCAAEAR